MTLDKFIEDLQKIRDKHNGGLNIVIGVTDKYSRGFGHKATLNDLRVNENLSNYYVNNSTNELSFRVSIDSDYEGKGAKVTFRK